MKKEISLKLLRLNLDADLVKTIGLLKHFFKYLLISVVVIGGCTNDPEAPLVNKHFFPLEKGLYWIYDVNEVQYRLATATESAYQLQIEVVDSFQNQNGYTYVLHRSKRETQSDPWVFIESWSVRVTQSEVIVNEGNLAVVHLAFPAAKGNKWDANVYNNQDEDQYSIIRSGFVYTTDNGLQYDQSVEVQQEDLLTIIDQDQRNEVFSYNVGLVFKEIHTIEFDQNGERIPQDGLDYVQELIEFGKYE